MSKVKIKLTTHDGKEYGYLAIGTGKNKDYFLGNASEQKATVFVQEAYKKTNDIFYYKVDGTHKYLDEHTKNGVVFPETPFLSADVSSVHAWQLNSDKQLVAIYAGQGAGALAPANTTTQDKIEKEHPGVVFCNLINTTRPYTVEIIPQ